MDTHRKTSFEKTVFLRGRLPVALQNMGLINTEVDMMCFSPHPTVQASGEKHISGFHVVNQTHKKGYALAE